MALCVNSAIEERQSCNWQNIAVHKDPQKLCSLSKTSIAKSFVNMNCQNIYKCKDNLRSMCHNLNTFFPMILRADIIEEVVSSQKVEDSNDVMYILLLQLLTDVRNLVVKSSDCEEPISLNKDECNFLLMELEGKKSFFLESMIINGVVAEGDIVSDILRRSPKVHTIHVSGEICNQVLSHLEEHPRSLYGLQLDNTFVNDREVIKALLGSQYDMETLANMICQVEGRGHISVPHGDLTYLSVDSPFITACGAVLLLYYLRKLNRVSYAQSVYSSLSFIEHVTPSKSFNFALNFVELWQPTPEVISSVHRLCPDIKDLMIENIQENIPTLQELSSFTSLNSLTLRHIPEEEIIAAIKSVGGNLQKLCIEYETLTPVSHEVIKAIQETCPKLRSLEMNHVRIEMKVFKHQSVKQFVLSELKTLKITHSDVHPSILEVLLVGNRCLNSLQLDVNREALTDQLVTAMMKRNCFETLSSIHLGGGTMSEKGITKLVVLPSLEKLSLAVESFPCISQSDFDSLKKTLEEGNYQCTLENTVH